MGLKKMTRKQPEKLTEIFAIKYNDKILLGIYKKEITVYKTRIVLNKGVDEI